MKLGQTLSEYISSPIAKCYFNPSWHMKRNLSGIMNRKYADLDGTQLAIDMRNRVIPINVVYLAVWF